MMRSSPLLGLCLLCSACLFAVACGDDTGGTGGGSGGSSTTSAASGDGGAGPTTTGAGGILDDGTEATVDACNAALDAEGVASTELGCPIEDDNEYCGETSSTWVPCVAEWKAYYECVGAATTSELCECADASEGDSGILCDYETACADELDAITACDQ